MKYIVTINNKDYEVEVEKSEAKLISVTQNAAVSTVVQAEKVEQVSNSSNNGEGEEMPSPMPGTVNGVMKQVGDVVKKGDVVIILEAMKMENEICAVKEGVIKQIIQKGASVATGDALFVIG